MNSREFTSELAKRVRMNGKKTAALLDSMLEEMSKSWTEGDAFIIQNFGVFEVKKKTERISVSPTTKQRMLIPPKLVLTFKPSRVFKENINK